MAVDFFLFFIFAEKYERDAKKYWDMFYKRHQDKVWKLRKKKLNFYENYVRSCRSLSVL